MIIKSEKYLGDIIHAYMVIKNIKDAGYNASLITTKKYTTLFDSNYITDNAVSIDFDFSNPIHCINYIKNNKIHIRDDIISNFYDIKPISHKLNIKPYKFNNKTVIICNRSAKPIKEWKGNWDNIINYLKQHDYSIIFDNNSYDLDTIVSYIAGSDFVISIDTGLIHVADAYNVPIIGLYANNLQRFSPYTNKTFCIERKLDNISPYDIINKIEELKYSYK